MVSFLGRKCRQVSYIREFLRTRNLLPALAYTPPPVYRPGQFGAGRHNTVCHRSCDGFSARFLAGRVCAASHAASAGRALVVKPSRSLGQPNHKPLLLSGQMLCCVSLCSNLVNTYMMLAGGLSIDRVTASACAARTTAGILRQFAAFPGQLESHFCWP